MALAAAVAMVAVLGALPGALGTTDAGTVKLKEGAFHTIQLALDNGTVARIAAKVEAGPRIDILLLDYPNFQLYREHKQFVWVSDGSRLDTDDANYSVTLAAGVWYVVLDNTDAGAADPGTVLPVDTQATVRFSVSWPYVAPPPPQRTPALRDEAALALAAGATVALVALVLVETRRAEAHEHEDADADPTQRVDPSLLEAAPRERRRRKDH